MKKIYDKRFVHFEWDDMLDGKECIVGDSLHDITTLIAGDQHCFKVVGKNVNDAGRFPFVDNDEIIYKFCYYDPLLVYKVAYNAGKRVDYKPSGSDNWLSVDSDSFLFPEDYEYRVIEKKEMDDKERYELMEELCARLRYIARTYKGIDLKRCVIIGGKDLGNYVSNVRYVYCATMVDYKLGNCVNYKACRDFEDGWK